MEAHIKVKTKLECIVYKQIKQKYFPLKVQ